MSRPVDLRPRTLGKDVVFAVDPTTAAAARRYPSVSLLVSLTGETPWRTRLAHLAREAEERLRAEFGEHLERPLVTRLRRAVADAAAPTGATSLAVYVNNAGSHVLGLDVDVRERTVIDDTFATRDLVADDLRKPRYWVLALNLDNPRLLHGHGTLLHGVPLELRDTHEHPSHRGGRHGRDRSDVIEARRTRRLRALDQALTEPLAANTEPLLVVGAEPTVSRFLDRTRHVARVEAVLRRAPDRDLGALARAIGPLLAEVLVERRVVALGALDRAVGAGTAASGIEPVWRAARRDPGLLLVEQSYEQAVRLLPGGGIAPTDDATAPGVVDDAVDEIIEAVLARGGRVELVHDGDLEDHQHVAFVPATRRRR